MRFASVACRKRLSSRWLRQWLMSRAELLVLRAGDEQVLREWTRASSIPAGLAQRGRILLLAAEGQSNTEIGRLVGVSLPTVRLWRGRYGEGGVEGLGDLHRSGRPAVHDETSIIAVTLELPPDRLGVTHWSVRLLGDHLGISFATVARIWRRWGLQPWKAETFKLSLIHISEPTRLRRISYAVFCLKKKKKKRITKNK